MISCEKYDYIEIACMHRYPIKLTMKEGNVVLGIALDTARNESRQECLMINADDGEVLVVLDDISILEVSVGNQHFKSISFS